MILVDTNVLVDIFTRDQRWFKWSFGHLEDALLFGPVFINEVIYAECSVRFTTIERFEQVLVETGVIVAPMRREALFSAGKAFAKYRRAGGIRTGVLPDFFIGAHAAVANIPLLTRDARRYRTYFPTIELIAPDAI